MFQINRHKKIYNYLLDKNNATVNELAEICDVAPMTIRRDLDKMESDGLITRVFGGAVIGSNIVKEIAYEEKEKASINEKISIASEASKLVSDNSIVLLDSGTTCMEIARNLIDKSNLKVITTDILIAAYLMKFKNIEVYCTGGRVQTDIGCCIDHMAVDYISKINADICFLGASAINNSLDVSTFTMDKVLIKQAMLKSSEYRILVADDTKFEKSSFAKICELTDFNLVITNKEIKDSLKETLIENGVSLQLV
ncbi:DeoR/GlpR family DNA-binding transcription regulator [Clostridioides mangenotii]|uniref:DeoR/GlpR family DNA-binding transcription regulator n=1 Tax=Metaclostridioides mangenotii TaxID=1540 RepID=UPI001C12336C|nr:DeoR/GlpR family DNA-binding transcription regulator [Clostridioides mangenotii]MBU5306217.1 DeoR/GlpR family DNA-binding transcription regulator [Clostridioides mangenotii]MCR1954279.1 DeoR/GlpR family DNA-binding transcription regulator [Clostridioides mangenotii]